MDCTPPGEILAKVVKARPTAGNYIGFAVLAVAGEGTITEVDIKGQSVGPEGLNWVPCIKIPSFLMQSLATLLTVNKFDRRFHVFSLSASYQEPFSFFI